MFLNREAEEARHRYGLSRSYVGQEQCKFKAKVEEGGGSVGEKDRCGANRWKLAVCTCPASVPIGQNQAMQNEL